MRSLCVCIALLLAGSADGKPIPRRVKVDGQRFVLVATNESIRMVGPNIVVKGPPYLPSVEGNAICNDTVSAQCWGSGKCSTCSTFNEADVNHIKSMGWNSIRLGVAWAGAQPRDEDALDADFLKRLHAVLRLTDATGIHVVLDNHGDMVGSAGCGNGLPMWFQKKAAPELIGKKLETGFPYSLVPELWVDTLGGYSVCGDNATKWAAHAGDPNYNLLNECCQAINSGNPAALGFTTVSQKTMDYMLDDGPGRADFLRFWSLVAQAVQEHPSAVAVEPMNEPMSIKRPYMFETWVAVAKAVNKIIPDMPVGLADTGEGAVYPSWLTGFGFDVIGEDTVEWIRNSNTVFYSWHWYDKVSISTAVADVLAIQEDWNVPSFLTEFMSCDAWEAAAAAGISHSYWHYSAYCNTGPAFGNRAVPGDTFGACILGWAGGDSSKTCSGPLRVGLIQDVRESIVV